MNGGTIMYIFEHDPFMKPLFAGISFADLPPTIKSFPAISIINTDCSTCPGEHWCAAYYSKHGKCEFFDPLGLPPKNALYDLSRNIRTYCKTIDQSSFQVQPETSSTCGHHCILFSFYRSRGYSKQFIEKYIYSPRDLVSNDIKAINIVKKFGIPFP